MIFTVIYYEKARGIPNCTHDIISHYSIKYPENSSHRVIRIHNSTQDIVSYYQIISRIYFTHKE